MKAFLTSLLLLAGCGGRAQDRCLAVKADLDACVGTTLAELDCATLSDGDLDRIHDLTAGTACSLLSGSLPLDGDYLSAACRLLDVGCVAPVTPSMPTQPARLPILLVNGIDTSPLFRYSTRIVSSLTEAGQPVYLATLPPFQPPRKRAPLLWQRVQEVMAATGASQVNLVCHSLGGLDCRYLVSPAGLPADLGDDAPTLAVASITTVATAHLGTPVADALVGDVPGGDRAKTVTDFASLIGDWFTPSVLMHDADVVASLGALSRPEARAFAAQIVDAPGIAYQSYAGVSTPRGEVSAALEARIVTACTPDDRADAVLGGPQIRHDRLALPLVPLAALLVDSDGQPLPSDGLVAVASARWGRFRGCVMADHMEQLGQHDLPDVNVRTGFDVARFYQNVASDLAGRGF